jgi:phage gpG-like protein
MGNDAVRHFKKSFRNGGFTDATLVRWKKREKKEKGKHRAVLVKTGALRRSIRVVKKSFNSVTIGSRTAGDYGEVHNEGYRGVQYVKPHKRQRVVRSRVRGSGGFAGGVFTKGKATTVELLGSRGNVKGFTRRVNIPKRQFIGHSFILKQKLRRKLNTRIVVAFNV